MGEKTKKRRTKGGTNTRRTSKRTAQKENRMRTPKARGQTPTASTLKAGFPRPPEPRKNRKRWKEVNRTTSKSALKRRNCRFKKEFRREFAVQLQHCARVGPQSDGSKQEVPAQRLCYPAPSFPLSLPLPPLSPSSPLRPSRSVPLPGERKKGRDAGKRGAENAKFQKFLRFQIRRLPEIPKIPGISGVSTNSRTSH